MLPDYTSTDDTQFPGLWFFTVPSPPPLQATVGNESQGGYAFTGSVDPRNAAAGERAESGAPNTTERDLLSAALRNAGLPSTPDILEHMIKAKEVTQAASYIPGAEGIEVVVNLNAAVPTPYQVDAANAIYKLLETSFADASHGTIRFSINYAGQMKKHDEEVEREHAVNLIKDVAAGAMGFVFQTKSGVRHIISRCRDRDDASSLEAAFGEADGTVIVVTRDSEVSMQRLRAVGTLGHDDASVRFMRLDEYDHLTTTEHVNPVFAGTSDDGFALGGAL